jgi:hypothetical protein
VISYFGGGGGPPLHYSVIENGNGLPGTSLNFCSYTCSPGSGNYVPNIMSSSHGSVNYACLAILPLQLNTFEYNYFNNAVVLNWQTMSEYNTDRFEIEKSNDGINFTKIGLLPGAGTSNTPKNYSFNDLLPSEFNYYRLKQVDINGKAIYSKVLLVKINGQNPLTIYPTIVHDQLHVNINLNQREISSVRVFDLAGRPVLQFNGNSGSKQVDVSILGAGNYFIRLQTKSGEYYNQRFIKQ